MMEIEKVMKKKQYIEFYKLKKRKMNEQLNDVSVDRPQLKKKNLNQLLFNINKHHNLLLFLLNLILILIVIIIIRNHIMFIIYILIHRLLIMIHIHVMFVINHMYHDIIDLIVLMLVLIHQIDLNLYQKLDIQIINQHMMYKLNPNLRIMII